jgi:hypothetical protein
MPEYSISPHDDNARTGKSGGLCWRSLKIRTSLNTDDMIGRVGSDISLKVLACMILAEL